MREVHYRRPDGRQFDEVDDRRLVQEFLASFRDAFSKPRPKRGPKWPVEQDS